MLRATWLDVHGRRWHIEIPRTRLERARGLLGRPHLPIGHALLLEGARSVHTIGMRFTIDTVLLDATLRVLQVVRMRPGRLLLPRRRVRHVLETAAGAGVGVGEIVHAIHVGPVVSVTVHPSDDVSRR
jgi:uncharacterized membrane protein (UPF0127 family)